MAMVSYMESGTERLAGEIGLRLRIVNLSMQRAEAMFGGMLSGTWSSVR
jgi:hypothetical protein